MAAIDLYLDPVCPFGWVAAQWLLDAANEHRTPVTLRQMSLAVLNDGNDVDSHHRPMIDRSRRLGRLFAAVTDQHGPDGSRACIEPSARAPMPSGKRSLSPPSRTYSKVSEWTGHWPIPSTPANWTKPLPTPTRSASKC